jgi:hypothetical protein
MLLNEVEIGKKVKVAEHSVYFGDNYPWWPNLLNKTGVISEVQILINESTVTTELLIKVKLDEPVMVQRPKEGVHAFGASGDDLTDPEPQQIFIFGESELELC